VSAALHHIPAGTTYVEFGDLAGERKADNGNALEGPFAMVGDVGDDELAIADETGQLRQLTGIDMTQVTSAVQFGRAPATVGILYGSFDTKAIGAKLGALGYKSSDLGGGETAWVVRDDHQVDASDQLSQLGIFGSLNVIHLSSSRLVYGGASTDIAALAAKGSAADDPAYAGVADCLHDAKAAVIADHGDAWPGVLGLGVGGDAKSQTQIVCVATASDAAAQQLAQSWVSHVGTAQMAKSNIPWTNMLSGAKAENLGGAGHVVRLTAHGMRANLLFQAVENQDLASLFPGSSTGS
jgi:hypothetical protein